MPKFQASSYQLGHWTLFAFKILLLLYLTTKSVSLMKPANGLNTPQIISRAVVLLAGVLIYLIDRPPDQIYFIYKSGMNISLFAILCTCILFHIYNRRHYKWRRNSEACSGRKVQILIDK